MGAVRVHYDGSFERFDFASSSSQLDLISKNRSWWIEWPCGNKIRRKIMQGQDRSKVTMDRICSCRVRDFNKISGCTYMRSISAVHGPTPLPGSRWLKLIGRGIPCKTQFHTGGSKYPFINPQEVNRTLDDTCRKARLSQLLPNTEGVKRLG